MLVEVNSENGKRLLDQLQAENLSPSLPFRGMLWNLLAGKFKDARAFANQWPTPLQMACVANTQEFSRHENWDMVTVYSRQLDSFYLFLWDVAKRRDWDRRGIIFQAILSELEPIIQQHFGGEELTRLGPFQVVVDPHPDRKSPIPQDLPQDLSMGLVRPDEAEVLAEYWGYGYPDKIEYLRWLIQSFPQACIRDRERRLVSWGLEFEFGGGAARFTIPEHRRRGLTRYLDPARRNGHYEWCPVPRFGGVSIENRASLEMALKVMGSKLTSKRYIVLLKKALRAL